MCKISDNAWKTLLVMLILYRGVMERITYKYSGDGLEIINIVDLNFILIISHISP